MSETQQQGFKRINFFKGFLTTEKDWNDAERYHIDKRRLHNRMMHSPGIVYGYAGDLRVNARARGDLSVEVQPGYAIDGMGNDLMIFDATIRNINLEEFRLPQTIYVVLRYYEELTDFIAYKENLEYKGHRRVLESCRVELSQTEPDIMREVELARIHLEKGVQRVRDARDPADPKPNEIDIRYTPKGGLSGSTSWRTSASTATRRAKSPSCVASIRCASARVCTSARPGHGGCTISSTRSWTTPSTRRSPATATASTSPCTRTTPSPSPTTVAASPSTSTRRRSAPRRRSCSPH